MEIMAYIYSCLIKKSIRSIAVILSLMISVCIMAQPINNSYFIKDGKMNIRLSKKINLSAIDSFAHKYNLLEVGLRKYIEQKIKDSILVNGWKFEEDNNNYFIISKPLFGANNFRNPLQTIQLTETVSPAINKPVQSVSGFGINNFKTKNGFVQNDSVVTFWLDNHTNAKTVQLSGEFTNWATNAINMHKSDKGWYVKVKLTAGKYHYKFIVDGNWILDSDNRLIENDGYGNTNSVYYKTNTTINLNGHTDARSVYLVGSFNKWKTNNLKLIKNGTGWFLPIYLPSGTYTYRFNVDGNWITDPDNKEVLPNEYNGYNNVISIGKKQLFKFDKFPNAKQVNLAGSFNDWRDFELPMKKTATGWQLEYCTGPGNHEYKYKVDGKWYNADGKDGDNSIYVAEPNYTFKLKGHAEAKSVYVSGDFNNWSNKGFPLKYDGNKWLLNLYLSEGKHLYKYIIDGKWDIDHDNYLWEQNEYGTGNSVLWMKATH